MNEKGKFPDRFTSSQFVKYISKEEIKGLTQSLANKIEKKYQGEELVVIGVLKGCLPFLSDLVQEIAGVKISVDFLKVAPVGRGKDSNGTIVLTKDLSIDILGKNVLIVEEIVDTGRALDFLIQRLKISNPKSIEVATLFDKPYKRAVEVDLSYIGKQIDDQFIIGYGLDLEEYGRNFEDVYFLRYPN